MQLLTRHWKITDSMGQIQEVRGDGGVLLTSEGDRFMFRYIPERFAAETAAAEEEAQRWLEGDKAARRPPGAPALARVRGAISRRISGSWPPPSRRS